MFTEKTFEIEIKISLNLPIINKILFNNPYFIRIGY